MVGFAKALATALSIVVAGRFTLVVESAVQGMPTNRDAGALLDSGLYEEAESVARRVAEAAATTFGPVAPESLEASEVLVRASIANGRGADADILGIAQQTLQHRRTAYPPGHPALAVSLLNLGDLLAESGDYARATICFEEAIGALREGSVSVSRDLTLALDKLGTAYASAGRLEDGARTLQRSLELKQRAVSEGSIELAPTLEALAVTRQAQGDYQSAGNIIRRALSLHNANGPSHPRAIDALNIYASQLWFEGQLSESRATSARAVELATWTLRADHPTTARSLQGLSHSTADLGYVEEARALQTRALDMARRTFGGESYQITPHLNDLANVNVLLGNYGEARTLFERALRLRVARLGARHRNVATILFNLAVVDVHLGDFANARRQLAAATTIWERDLSVNHPFVAVALTEFATLLRDEGSPGQALAPLRRALRIREQALGSNHLDVGTTLAELAITLTQLGRATEAEGLAERALRIWDTVGTPNAPEFASALSIYGTLQARRDDLVSARRYFERALAVRRAALGPAHPALAETLAQLARAALESGDVDTAIRYSQRG